LRKIYKKRRGIVVLGTGGVGKTTIAAALALGAAQGGLRTAAITIDPARRLREAFGMSALDGNPTPIEPYRLTEAGLDPELPLYAMMLDVKARWDGMVERLVGDPATRRAILGNRFYRGLSESFAGADAYAALEQLYDLHESCTFDFEVVDTPPAAQALEILQAPSRLAHLFDSDIVRALAAGGSVGSGFAMRIAGGAARLVASQLEAFAGLEMLASIGEFLNQAAGVGAALLERFRKADALLHSPDIQFVLVTTPERDRLAHAREVARELDTRGLRLAAVVINRFGDEESWQETRRPHPDDMTLSLDSVIGQRDGMASLASWLRGHLRATQAERLRAEEFARSLPRAVRVMTVPALSDGAAELSAVALIAGYLAVEAPSRGARTNGGDRRKAGVSL
jgi:anion-transporting  ArsA/GET3 family ATPase